MIVLEQLQHACQAKGWQVDPAAVSMKLKEASAVLHKTAEEDCLLRFSSFTHTRGHVKELDLSCGPSIKAERSYFFGRVLLRGPSRRSRDEQRLQRIAIRVLRWLLDSRREDQTKSQSFNYDAWSRLSQEQTLNPSAGLAHSACLLAVLCF
jgi:hypothetical protein